LLVPLTVAANVCGWLVVSAARLGLSATLTPLPVLTVSVAGLLVWLPAVLVTVTVNVAQFSANRVAGVV
jgi:hypothetical protein